jgi:ketosteroid isomerase-like protein
MAQTDWSLESARAFMARAENAFKAGNQEAILDLFDEDVEVIFADFPPMRGKNAYRKFLEARMKRQLSYTPETTVRVVGENVIGSSWEASWMDALTGLEMRGRGCEFVSIRDGKVIQFIASFNAWNEKQGPATPIV